MNALLRSVHEEISRSCVRNSYSAQAALFDLFRELRAENGRVLRRQEHELQFPGRYSLLILAQDCVYPTMQRCFGASGEAIPEQEVHQIIRGISARPLAFVIRSPQRMIVLPDGETPATAFASEARGALLVDYCCKKLSDYNCKVVNVHTGENFRALDERAQENWYVADRIHQWLRQRFEELFRLSPTALQAGIPK